jgi:hypothetical protein
MTSFHSTPAEVVEYTMYDMVETVLDMPDSDVYIQNSRNLMYYTALAKRTGKEAFVWSRLFMLILIVSAISLKFKHNSPASRGLLTASLWISGIFTVVLIRVVIESTVVATCADAPTSMKKGIARIDIIKSTLDVHSTWIIATHYVIVIATLLFCTGVTLD